MGFHKMTSEFLIKTLVDSISFTEVRSQVVVPLEDDTKSCLAKGQWEVLVA